MDVVLARGREVVAIGLAHNVAFFGEVAEAFFKRLVAEGVEFVPLEEAAADPAYARSGSFVSDQFLVYPVKVGREDGLTLDAVPPSHRALIDRVFELAAPLRPARRGLLVDNRRPRPA